MDKGCRQRRANSGRTSAGLAGAVEQDALVGQRGAGGAQRGQHARQADACRALQPHGKGAASSWGKHDGRRAGGMASGHRDKHGRLSRCSRARPATCMSSLKQQIFGRYSSSRWKAVWLAKS